MGKARILSAEGQGLYTIEIIEDRARAESARALAVSQVQGLDERISSLEQQVAALQAVVDQAADEQDQAITEHQQQLAETGVSDVGLSAFAKAVLAAAAERDRVLGEIRQLKVERLGLQARISRIDALPPLRQVQAWCADLTEGLEGDVGTAEVPGEAGQVIIKPGFEGNAWSATADGAMQPAVSATPAGVFYNLAMLPGWQKWRPTYRIATITSITNDLCDISLVPTASSQQGLNVNAELSYADVPIQYMTCNANAFEVGDRVLVRFDDQNHEQPVVVGFESQPRACQLAIAFPIVLNVQAIAYGAEFTEGTRDCYPPLPGHHTQQASRFVGAGVFHEQVRLFSSLSLSELSEAATLDDVSAEFTNIITDTIYDSALIQTPMHQDVEAFRKVEGVCTPTSFFGVHKVPYSNSDPLGSQLSAALSGSQLELGVMSREAASTGIYNDPQDSYGARFYLSESTSGDPVVSEVYQLATSQLPDVMVGDTLHVLDDVLAIKPVAPSRVPGVHFINGDPVERWVFHYVVARYVRAGSLS